jgi:pimeloyl-ACP methyl ester carboxylesterase
VRLSLELGEERLGDDGLRERAFAFEEGGERVPGLLWLPAAGAGPRPLVLGGHGYGLDKRFPFPTPALRSLATRGGCAVAILDAPGHGERRADPAQDFEATAAAYQEHWGRFAGSRIEREYATAARLLRGETDVGQGPVGYWGLSLATQYGLAYLAGDARAAPDDDADAAREVPPSAAVLGLFRRGKVVAHYAARVRCPVFFIQQLDDEIHPRDEVAALFDEIAAPVKYLAASPGAHIEVPEDVIRAAVDFLLSHLAPTRSTTLGSGE